MQSSSSLLSEDNERQFDDHDSSSYMPSRRLRRLDKPLAKGMPWSKTVVATLEESLASEI